LGIGFYLSGSGSLDGPGPTFDGPSVCFWWRWCRMAAPSAVSIWCIVDRVRPGEEPPSVGCFASPGQAGRRRGQRLVRRMEIWTLVRTRCRSGTKGRCRQTRCRSGTKGRCRQTSLVWSLFGSRKATV